MRLKTALIASTLLAPVVLTAPVQAQTVTDAPSDVARSAKSDGADHGIQEIIVTAQRRSENLQKTALAVSAVAGDALVKQSISQATDLTRLVPALQIAPAASYTQIYLRGIGTFGANAFADQGVAFNLDGIYLSRPPPLPRCSTTLNAWRCSRDRRARFTGAMPRAARSMSSRPSPGWARPRAL
jgi:iron complex outermembrane receptor protein